MPKPFKFHISNVLLEPAGFEELNVVYELDSIKYMDEVYVPLEIAGVSLTFSNGGSGFIYVSGNVGCSFKTTCTRCLGDAIYDIDAEVDGYIKLNANAEMPEDVEDSECIKPEGDRNVDLTDLIYSSVLLELPLNPICSDDCENSNYKLADEVTDRNTYMPFKDLKSKL